MRGFFFVVFLLQNFSKSIQLENIEVKYNNIDVFMDDTTSR